MTDVFPIDFEVDGFRKNNLDWSKFRNKYNKVSATKIERGIKPLPLSLLLKLFGPQKVFNTYVISHHTSDLDNQIHKERDSKDLNMRPCDRESTMTKTVNFPGTGLLGYTNDDAPTGEPKPKVNSKTVTKREGLPLRPAFQRGIRVPGRYFPKPTTAFEETVSQSATFHENQNEKEHRPRTQTPRSVVSQTASTTRANHSYSTRSSRIVRGPMCKSTDTFSGSSGRTPTMSGRSVATPKSVSSMSTNGFSHFKMGYHADDNMDALGLNFRGEPNVNGLRNYEQHHTNDNQNEMSIIKRLRYSCRQVSFPRSSKDFTAVLQGRPKTLHPRDLLESPEGAPAREPRSRTHVGFVDELT